MEWIEREQAAKDRLVINKKSSSVKKERRGKAVILGTALLIILATIAITLFLVSKGLQSFVVNGVSPIEFISSTEWSPSNEKFGALPFIFGSFAVTVLSALIAAPLGIGAAIFMTEIAPSWGQRILQPVVELLVGIPSVVYGFIGLTVVVPFIRENVGGQGFGLLAGTVVLSIMILPTITSISTDAMRSLPGGLRESSYAVGATRWQTIYRVLVPAASPVLLTAVVLGMARAFGEALAVQMVIGNSRDIASSLVESTGTLTTIITLNIGHTTFGSLDNNVLWSLGLILLIMSYVFIIIIRYLSSRRKI
ncbi:phosphate ABC transporter permease subunit PstC [Alteribacillus bidgolensis]|uniref:Phosphate transport system permease protein n=1 Tax=Alteribacillus bidgolensis TaxID=930129 RepID=A0A1G8MNM8_9BACI|nr:phosphate ABC transporter permease subunit PstC [Alteribacillus bidgolensis]SDI69502.1 phosphate ABC transporter membrane protein 1, PhoT family [Alteribacillus bidgolensis]